MPFTRTPTQDTYKSVPIPFNGVQLFRSGDLTVQRDTQIVNMHYDRVTQENQKRTVALRKRSGLADSLYTLNKVSSANPIRGSYVDRTQNAFYWAVGNKLYNVKPDTSATPNLLATLNTSAGYVGFTGFIKSTNARYVCISDGTDLWVHDYGGGTCNRVVDADMPTPHQPYPIEMDGYICLIKLNTGDLYNSDNDDPTSWTAGNFISAEMNSDYAIRPVRAKNYMAILGTDSIEYFYDAANSTGSPFSRYDSAYREIGYVTGGCSIGDSTFFVGQEGDHNVGVYMLNSFKVERVSNAVVDSTIQSFASTSNTKSRVPLNKDGMCVSVDGHNFYVIVCDQTTWAYDIEEKFWYEWKGSDGLGLALEASWQMYDGSAYVAVTNRSFMSVMSPSLYQDFGSNFICRYTTDNVDADTFYWKNCHRLYVVADKYQNTGTSYLNVTWSDNDWGDGGNGITRQLNLFSATTPAIRGLGRFRNRSWRFEYSDNYPLRLSSAYMDINVGIH